VHFGADGKTNNGFADAHAWKFGAEDGEECLGDLGAVMFFGFVYFAGLPEAADFVEGGCEDVLINFDE
jgi:hypothetical protein